MMSAPLGLAPLTRTVAWHQGRPLTAAALLADAQALASRFPATGQPVNLCQDRYLFSVGLLAAVLQGRLCLLPPNALPHTLAQLQPAGQAAPFLLVDDAEVLGPAGAASLTCLTLAHSPADSEPAQADAEPHIDITLPAFSLLTSGSTGAPTAHPKSWHTAQLITQAGVASLAAQLGLAATEGLAGLNIVATVPPQHSYGIESSILLALLGGAAFDCGRPFFPADVAAALERVPPPRALVTTPFHLKAVVQAGIALPEVALIVSATAPLSPQLAQQAEAAFGGQLIEIYGCTEAGQVATRRTTQTEVWQTMGELRLRREAEGAQQEAGQAREPETEARVIVQGGHVAQATPLADVMELLSDERFRLLGRANDLIHVAGKRSSLGHLNYHLNRIEGVLDGAFWQPEEQADGVGRLVAFVVAPGVSAAHIVQALRPWVDAAFLPRRVVPVEALPREATGKLTASALREFALRTLAPGAGA